MSHYVTMAYKVARCTRLVKDYIFAEVGKLSWTWTAPNQFPQATLRPRRRGGR
jgi:hypothetical protein